jgi:CHAT domain-containing protein
LEILEAASGKAHPNVAVALNNIGSVYEAQGRMSEALDMYKRSLAIYERSRDATWPAVIGCLRNIATLQMQGGDMAESLPPAAQAFRLQREYLLLRHQQATDLEALTAASQYRIYSGFFQAACGVAAASGLPGATAAGAEQLALSKALLEEVRVAQASLEADTTTRGFREQRQAVQAQIQRLSESAVGSVERDFRLKILEQDLRETEAKLGERNSLMNQTLLERELTLADIARGIPREAVVLDLVQYRRCDFAAKVLKEPRYAAYLTFPLAADSTNVAVERVDLGEAAPINEAVELVCKRMSAGQFAAQDVSPALQRLSQLVYAPLAPHLTHVAHLIVCPDGQLSRLPFEMLPVGDKFLIEEKTISYVGSGREIVRLQRRSGVTPDSNSKPAAAEEVRPAGSPSSVGKSLVMGNPDFDLDLAKVRSRRREAPLNAERGMTNAESSQSFVASATRSLSRDCRGMRFPPLPDAEAEARSVARLLGGDTVLRLGADAREAELKAVVSPRVLHLATHGFFLSDQEFKRTNSLPDSWAGNSGARWNASLPKEDWENPLIRCGLALAGANHFAYSDLATRNLELEDGVLTGLEASLLNLQGTELVILSACDSGSGEVKIGEGVMSLRRAFRIAGAETVLASHWKVSDRATSQLMTEFMRRWRAGEPRVQAWREAQLSLIGSKGAKEDFSNPFFWSAFTLTGQWR